MLKESPRLYPGVAELVRELQGRARLAIVSGTWRENITAVLDAVGLADCFDTIIGKDDVIAVKPAPDAYLLALKRLRLVGKSTVALEDSPTGLTSARAAGIRAIAFLSANGSAMPPTFPVLSPPTDCSSIWGFKVNSQGAWRTTIFFGSTTTCRIFLRCQVYVMCTRPSAVWMIAG
jgi:beta-phosphoglucomutase-like phosphatase (HAD superfamily)